jgi:hypothetical protein
MSVSSNSIQRQKLVKAIVNVPPEHGYLVSSGAVDFDELHDSPGGIFISPQCHRQANLRPAFFRN